MFSQLQPPMPYLTTVIALLCLIALHLWWLRRFRKLRDQHDRAVQEREARQQALFDSMAEGVLIVDRNERIQLANSSLQRLFKLTMDVRGQTISEAYKIETLSELLKRLRDEPAVHGCEFELPGVEERWIQVNAAAVIDNSRVAHGFILVFHDLTRLKQLENTRRDFVANVSHELRTPLSLIKGFVETLLEGAKDNPELAGQFLRTIEKHADRLTFLIEDLLTISRLESGRTVLDLHSVDLREEVQRVIDDLHARAGDRKTRLVNEVPPDLRARADTDRLQQVLFNLVENAIKYGRPESAVTVAAKTRSDNNIVVSVQDNGPGIPVEARERVFERFYRVDRARSRESGGTGLGLAIVKHIVQGHGGEVWVESEMGVGTTFRFTLPQ
jgi:two-component system, OmpR family, phosphate regulon sensor histidine kinase PhoR